MYQTHNLLEPPQQLAEYLAALEGGKSTQLRRRALFACASDNTWVLICCVVEAFPDSEQKKELSRIYERALLFEDWLTPYKCERFIKDVQRGEIAFGDAKIQRPKNANWSIELLPAGNDFMGRAGVVVGTKFEERMPVSQQEPLIALDLPYYPDVHEAARVWLPMKKYNGFNDGRRGEVVFVLPEARAYFTAAEHDKGTLIISVGGRQHKTMSLLVKGGYWEDDRIANFEANVENGQARLFVPDNVKRLHYLLLDATGFVLDFQQEDRFRQSKLRRKNPKAVDNIHVQQVETARNSGEGQLIEFKPFIRLDEGFGTKENPRKLREVVTSIVAFANAQGGHLFLGITNECVVSGLGQDLQAWAKASPDEAAVEKYRGSLLSALKDHVEGDVALSLRPIKYKTEWVILIAVAPTSRWPLAIKGDARVIVRVGANNKHVPAYELPSHMPKPTESSSAIHPE